MLDDDIGLARGLVEDAVVRYRRGKPEPGDAQLVLGGTIHAHQHKLGEAIEGLTVALTAFLERSDTNGSRRLRDRAREAVRPVIGFGALAGAIAWVMDHFRPG